MGGQARSNVVPISPERPDPAVIERAAAILRRGGLVAFPTETVYGLGAHALDRTAVRRIFEVKQRPDWDPLIVHVVDTATARELMGQVPDHFIELSHRFWPGPLTLVVEKQAKVPDEVTAGRPTVALRLPHHPVAQALLAESQLPIAAPSANRFGRPSPTCAQHVVDDLGRRVDLILDGGPTRVGVESTVLDLTRMPPRILRPGGISREELESVVGPVPLADPVAPPAGTEGQAGPGMSLKHYAPRARLELFEGDPACAVRALADRATALRANGQKIGVILHWEAGPVAAAHHSLVFGSWGDWAQMANRLFGLLRALDGQQVDVILCLVPPAQGLGLAVRDRLQRAAGVRE